MHFGDFGVSFAATGGALHKAGDFGVCKVGWLFLFWMVFIGNPRSGTNMGGEDRIVLRSKPNYLRLLHTWSIMSTKIEVEMVVGRVVIPSIMVHPPILRPRQPQ